jgi:hypothetical protein
MRLAGLAVMLLAGSAHAAPWTEWVGDYKTALTWRGCTTPGARSATLALDAIDGALAIDLAPAKGGLRSISLVEDERGTLSAQDGDLVLGLAHGRAGVELAIDLASGCTVRARLTRVRDKVAACDRLVSLARIARTCTKTQLPAMPPLAVTWKPKDAPQCRARAEVLETALTDAGCMPVESPVLLGARCRQVADEAAKLMRCPSLPPPVQALAEQLRTTVRSSADAAQRELAELACDSAHVALVELAAQARCPL